MCAGGFRWYLRSQPVANGAGIGWELIGRGRDRERGFESIENQLCPTLAFKTESMTLNRLAVCMSIDWGTNIFENSRTAEVLNVWTKLKEQVQCTCNSGHSWWSRLNQKCNKCPFKLKPLALFQKFGSNNSKDIPKTYSFKICSEIKTK